MFYLAKFSPFSINSVAIDFSLNRLTQNTIIDFLNEAKLDAELEEKQAHIRGWYTLYNKPIN